VSGVGKLAVTTKEVANAIHAVKDLLAQAESIPATPPSNMTPPPLQPFHPQISDPFAGGREWLPELQNLAGQLGNSWVPPRTQGLFGIDLTGIWSPPLNFSDQTYLRQFGPYLNFIAGIGGLPLGFGEGLFDPSTCVMHILGRGIAGVPMDMHGQFFPNWTIQGTMRTQGSFGQLIQLPTLMMKIA
jgi:hypothetical protein